MYVYVYMYACVRACVCSLRVQMHTRLQLLHAAEAQRQPAQPIAAKVQRPQVLGDVHVAEQLRQPVSVSSPVGPRSGRLDPT